MYSALQPGSQLCLLLRAQRPGAGTDAGQQSDNDYYVIMSSALADSIADV